MPLGTLDRTPPPFFRQGPSALTKLIFFSALAVFLGVLGGISAHAEDDVGVFQVAPVIGHCAPSEAGGQTDHRRAVSNPGLLL